MWESLSEGAGRRVGWRDSGAMERGKEAIPETVKCRNLNAASKQLGDTKSKNKMGGRRTYCFIQ